MGNGGDQQAPAEAVRWSGEHGSARGAALTAPTGAPLGVTAMFVPHLAPGSRLRAPDLVDCPADRLRGHRPGAGAGDAAAGRSGRAGASMRCRSPAGHRTGGRSHGGKVAWAGDGRSLRRVGGERLSACAHLVQAPEAVWELAEQRYLYIVQLPERAGHALHSLFVNDLDERIDSISARRIDPPHVRRTATVCVR